MTRLFRVVALVLVTLVANQAIAKSPFNFISFRSNKSVAKSSQLLTEENGPWMVFVSAFAGEGAEQEARQLVDTLRQRFRLNAYLHKEQYDYTGKVVGKGFNRYGGKKKMRYNTNYAFEEVAVLVGDFESVNDPKLQKALKAIKYATRDQLSLKGKQTPTTRRWAGIRDSVKKFTKSEEKRRKGPLGNAFATRNPMIPKEAFAPTGLSQAVIKMNKGVKNSLLENPGKYSVRVASFRGQVIIDQRQIHDIETNRRQTDGRINQTDEQAEELCALLRDKNIEAYVYHDLHESIVTVGSFAEIGAEQPNGTIELQPKVAKIMEMYGPRKQAVPGGGSSYAGVMPQVLTNGHKQYPLDIAPQPILVPRRSIATDYLSR